MEEWLSGRLAVIYSDRRALCSMLHLQGVQKSVRRTVPFRPRETTCIRLRGPHDCLGQSARFRLPALREMFVVLPDTYLRCASRMIEKNLVVSNIRHGPIITVGHPIAIGLGPPGISTTISITRHAI